jgi:hypothetical protein
VLKAAREYEKQRRKRKGLREKQGRDT